MSDQGARQGGGARELPPECARLAATLRELRAGTGLSLAGLAARTPYSKSSWERYLNGRALPPRQAVEQLCVLAGADAARPLALWELAEAAWRGRSGRTSRPGATGEETGPPPRTVTDLAAAPRRRPRIPVLYAGILCGLSLLAAGTLIVLSRSADGPGGDRTAGADLSVPSAGCHAASCTGKDAEDLECATAAQPPVPLGERRLDGTMVKVRRSDVCDTVWARIDRGTTGDLVELVVPGSKAQQTRVKDEFDEMSSVSTPMAHVPENVLNRVQACLVRQGERRCFTATPG